MYFIIRRIIQSNSSNKLPYSTNSPYIDLRCLILASLLALILCSIFIASITINV